MGHASYSTRFARSVRATARGSSSHRPSQCSITIPQVIGDDHCLTPLTSYGTQKAIRAALSDYTRRGFLDGIGIRLPTICVRPGRPNLAASGFSSIIREPLNGEAAVLPVPDSVRHWHASPRAAVGLLHAATVDERLRHPPMSHHAWGLSDRRRADRIASAHRGRRSCRSDPARARRERDADRRGLAEQLDTRRATALGFRADVDFDEIVQVHVQDELGGVIPLATR